MIDFTVGGGALMLADLSFRGDRIGERKEFLGPGENGLDCVDGISVKSTVIFLWLGVCGMIDADLLTVPRSREFLEVFPC
jgi:hypothetical protein